MNKSSKIVVIILSAVILSLSVRYYKLIKQNEIYKSLTEYSNADKTTDNAVNHSDKSLTGIWKYSKNAHFHGYMIIDDNGGELSFRFYEESLFRISSSEDLIGGTGVISDGNIYLRFAESRRNYDNTVWHHTVTARLDDRGAIIGNNVVVSTDTTESLAESSVMFHAVRISTNADKNVLAEYIKSRYQF